MAFKKGHNGIINGKPLRSKESYKKHGELLSKSYKGNKKYSFIENLKGGMQGKKHTEETKSKMSVLAKRQKGKLKPFIRGAKNANWKGGVTPQNKIIRHSIEYRLWRESVFARDGWKCKGCKKVGGKLNAHHIKPFARFPELRFAIDNGVTLCTDCHKKEHTRSQGLTSIRNL